MSALCLLLLLPCAWCLALRSSSYWFDASRCQLLLSPAVTSFSPLDIEVLIRVVACQPPIRLHPFLPPVGYLLSFRALHSCHLFLGVAPWWASLLPRDRVWVLFSRESAASLSRAGRVLCRTRAEFRTARQLCSSTLCQEVGFAGVAQRKPVYPAPAAGNSELSVLYLGERGRSLQENWARLPELPPLRFPASDPPEGAELAAHAVHLCPREPQRSRFFGAIVVEEASDDQLLESVRALARLPLAERARFGWRSQSRYRKSHQAFLKRFPGPQPEVFFFTSPPPARTGGQLYNREMVRELGAQRIAVHCCDLLNLRQLSGTGSTAGAAPFSLALLALLSWRRQLLVVDQVYAHSLAPALALRALLGSGKTVVVVHHLERYDSARPGALSRWRHRAQLGPADLVITVSQYCRREILSLGVPDEKIRVISGGTRPARLPDEPRRDLPGRPIRLLFVGHCVARKGLPALLRALARLDGQAFQLRLVGDHETRHFRNEIAPLIRESGLGDQVLVEGRVSAERLAECLREADAFVFPSYQEGYGLAVLEAMISGLPVLCSRTSALPELVEDGHSGYLFEPGNPEAIARTLQRVLDDPQALIRMGRAARLRGLQEPTWKESRARFYRALEPLLGG